MKSKAFIMKTIYKLLNKIDNQLNKAAIKYIEKSTNTFFPRSNVKEDDEDDNEPILFI